MAELSLNNAGLLVVQQNPELKAARFMIEEARARQKGAGRLMNPELELIARHMTSGNERGFTAAIMQRFPLTARLRLEKAVTSAQLAAAKAEVNDMERRLVAEIPSVDGLLAVSLCVTIFIAPTLFCAVEEWKFKRARRLASSGSVI